MRLLATAQSLPIRNRASIKSKWRAASVCCTLRNKKRPRSPARPLTLIGLPYMKKLFVSLLRVSIFLSSMFLSNQSTDLRTDQEPLNYT